MTQHKYKIVTHWNNGFCYKASSGLGTIDFKDGKFNHTLDIFDEDEDSPYFFKDVGLFKNYARVPAPDNYGAMDFSLYSVSDRAVSHFRKLCRDKSGYDIAFEQDENVQQNVPYFQILCNLIISTPERNKSLATVILPPYWNKSEKYPVFFNGYYDTNANLFLETGIELLEAIAKIRDTENKGTIGIFWNGGGANACRTVQYSAYGGLEELFKKVIAEYSASSTEIICFGGSRGGISALVAAANPLAKSYSIAACISCNPPLDFIDAPMFSPFTYPLLFSVLDEDSGYKNAWKKSFNGDIYRLFLNNLAGKRQNDDLSFPPDLLVLQKTAPLVHLCFGTNDIILPSYSRLNFAQKMQDLGVNFNLSIGFGAGHNNPIDLMQTAVFYMRQLICGKQLISGQISFYKKNDTDCGYTKISNKKVPLTVSLPELYIKGEKMSIEIVGNKDTEYSLYLTDNNGKQIKTVCGILGKAVYLDKIAADYYHIKLNLKCGSYRWSIEYKIDGVIKNQHGGNLTVSKNENSYITKKLVQHLIKDNAGSGICELYND